MRIPTIMLSHFCRAIVINKLHLNIAKCKYIHFCKSLESTDPKMTYSPNNIVLETESVSLVRDLGMLFDNKLTFFPPGPIKNI